MQIDSKAARRSVDSTQKQHCHNVANVARRTVEKGGKGKGRRRSLRRKESQASTLPPRFQQCGLNATYASCRNARNSSVNRVRSVGDRVGFR